MHIAFATECTYGCIQTTQSALFSPLFPTCIATSEYESILINIMLLLLTSIAARYLKYSSVEVVKLSMASVMLGVLEF